MPYALQRPGAVRRACAVALASALLAGGVQAAEPAAQPAGKPVLTGMWMLEPKDFHNEGKPPLTAEAAKVAQAEEAAIMAGKVISDAHKKCLPSGMPMMMTNEFALEILETPGRVTFVSEMSPLVRTVYLDQTSHPADTLPMWNGHSIGRWEGQTLVIDVAFLNDRISHIPGGGLLSDATHIVERYHLENDGKDLVGEMTFEDPKVLTRPWTVKHTYHRLEDKAELWEYACEIDAKGWSERFDGDPQAASKP